VALKAYERATGQADGLDNALEAQGLHRVCDAFPEDERWDYDDTDQRRGDSRASQTCWANSSRPAEDGNRSQVDRSDST
jgi:hypothetical protein